MREPQLVRAAGALVAIQIIHAAIPAKTSAEGYVGLVAGAVALAASVAAFFGLRAGKPWARPLLGVTGTSVAVGFLLYHALPIHSLFTNPYFGTPGIGILQWAPVIGAIGIGTWCAVEAWRSTTPAAVSDPAPATH